ALEADPRVGGPEPALERLGSRVGGEHLGLGRGRGATGLAMTFEVPALGDRGLELEPALLPCVGSVARHDLDLRVLIVARDVAVALALVRDRLVEPDDDRRGR